MTEYYNKHDIVIYKCDNLELLRSMSDKSVNLIYCDILYNTGKVFDDYNDNLGTPKEAVEWYRPRFEEMKRVLKANGSIFIHCNWRLDSYIRILLDEIFGPECFRNRIYRKHSEERGFYSNFDSQMDIILYYVKDPTRFVFHETRGDKPQIVPLFENGYLEGRSESRYANGYLINLGDLNKHWLVSKRQFTEMIAQDEIRFIDGLPYRYSTVIPVGNLWATEDMLDTYTRTNTAEAYDTPKPDAVLERIIRTCSDPGDTVADFFFFFGTTAVITKKLGRKGIFCDISGKACRTTVRKLDALKK